MHPNCASTHKAAGEDLGRAGTFREYLAGGLMNVTIMLGCGCCCGFWVLGGAEQVSRKSGAQSVLLLLSHLFIVCPHQDTF